jgi:hypothetical protein
MTMDRLRHVVFLTRAMARLTVAVPLLLVPSASAQQATDALKWETSSFLFARYSTESSSAVYSAFGFGKVGLLLGAVKNPRDGYHEVLAGMFSQVAWGQQSTAVAFALANASDSNYLQGYLAPSFVAGRLLVSGTVEVYEPLQSAGSRQLYVNPLTAVVALGPRVSGGGVYSIGLAAGTRPEHRGGPLIQVRIPRGSVSLGWLLGTRSLNEGRIELRRSF